MRTMVLSLLAVTFAVTLCSATRLHADEADEDAQFALELLSCTLEPVPPSPPDNPMLPKEPADEDADDGEPASAGGAAEETAQQSRASVPARLADFVARCIAWFLAALADGPA